jgi:hypothetical protein
MDYGEHMARIIDWPQRTEQNTICDAQLQT